MSSGLILIIIIVYFLVLIGISYFTGKNNDNDTFFKGNKQSPWYLVAFGMIGASLSGVTFISIPGGVGNAGMGYMQIVLGYFIGYFIVAYVLLPLYYRMNLTTIYTYLQKRFGENAYKTGATYFLISRIAGASIRLLLVANVLHEFIFKAWGVPFEATVAISILLIWIYTFRGGIKTVVWTDTLQTTFMLLAVVLTIFGIASDLGTGISGLISEVYASDMSNIFHFEDINAKDYFWKQVLGGMFITICMTGLDQDMMQKNLTCKNIGEAQKNMVSFSTILVFVNLMFLFLGALLFMYAQNNGVDLAVNENSSVIADQVYPNIALAGELGITVGILFILGLVAAAYSLTSLTTTVFVDFMDNEAKTGKQNIRTRTIIHIAVSLVILATVILFKYTLTSSAINQVLFVGSLTYGPLLGMFAFGLISKKKVKDKFIPFVCVASPILSYYLSEFSPQWFNGYQFGFELLAVNGLITYFGLWLLRK